MTQSGCAVAPLTSFIIPLSQTNKFDINLADTIIITHITQNITNLIHSFIVSSFSDVMILYAQKNATATQTAINTLTKYDIMLII